MSFMYTSIHRSWRVRLFVPATLIVGLVFVGAGCSKEQSSNTTPANTNTSASNSSSTNSSSTNSTNSSNTNAAVNSSTNSEDSEDAGLLPTGELKEFDIIAQRWEFSPDTITVKQGDTVKLSIQSIDVEHGFSLKDFGINETLTPGETVEVEFVADKKGTFSFFCTVFCGSGHTEMKGVLVVE